MIVQGVVALCLFINGELKEHRIQPAMSDCLITFLVILSIAVTKFNFSISVF